MGFKSVCCRFFNGIGGLCLRVPLGLYFIIAGARKIQGGADKFAEKALAPENQNWVPLHNYIPFIPELSTAFPEQFMQIYMQTLPFLQVLLGGMLILGVFTPVAAFGLFGIMVSIMLARTWMGNMEAVRPKPFDPNLIKAMVALAIVFRGAGMFSVDTLLTTLIRGKRAGGQTQTPAGSTDIDP